MWRPFEDSTVTGEVYYQSLGASNPDEYLDFMTSDRFARRNYGWLVKPMLLCLGCSKLHQSPPDLLLNRKY